MSDARPKAKRGMTNKRTKAKRGITDRAGAGAGPRGHAEEGTA
jgi:hypothetical protein